MAIDWRRDSRRLIMVVFGSVLIAVNIKTFARAGGLYPGGFTGLSLLLQTIFSRYVHVEIPFSVLNTAFNALPAYIGFKYLGRKFTILSIITIVLSSVLTDLLPAYPITSDPLLISVFGGILGAFAGSLCLNADATAGGTDFIAMFLAQKYERDAFNYILIGNVMMLGIAGLLFGWSQALYSIIYQFTSTQALRMFYKRYQKHTLFIITDEPNAVYEAIQNLTHHGGTLFRGTGLHAQEDRFMVYSVVSSDEIRPVLSCVRKCDPHAFVNVVKTDHFTGRFYRRPTD